MTLKKIARNDPCPCGSGKKYKQCCLQLEAGRPLSSQTEAMAISNALQTANGHLEAGRLLEADAICKEVLQTVPNHPDALYLLGMIAHQIGMHDVAAVFFGNVIEIAPDFADAHNNLGVALMAQGNLADAVASYQKTLSLQPGHTSAHYNLGNAFKDQGRLNQAVSSYQKAVQLTPNHAQLHNNLGDALQTLGKLNDAIASYRKALRINSSLAEVHFNLGCALEEQDTLEEAVSHYRQAIALKPDYAEAHNNLANMLNKQGQQEEAIAQYRQAISIKPDFAAAHSNLGDVYFACGRLDDAVASCQEAIRLKPDLAPAYNSLGNACRELGQLEKAAASIRQAILLKPDYAEAYNNLGNVLQAQGELEEAIGCYRQGFSIKSDSASTYSNLLYTLLFTDKLSPAEVFSEHQRYAERFETPLKPHWQPHANKRDPHRRLRVGYVSADFYNHAVAFFIEPILANHDKSRVEVFCYYNHTKHDSHTEQIAKCADHWLVCAKMSDEQLAGRIRADGIDILVDLSGHTGYNRLLTFARKPAPVQITWIGYPGSTGLTAMDYRITNMEADPLGLTERYHSESLLRLPDIGIAFQPEPDIPPVNPLPALTNKTFILASLNNLSKINRQVVSLWARILAALPEAKLMLGNVTDSGIEKRLIEQFNHAGVATERLILKPRLPINDYLALHHHIDLALDPFPYNGGTTTMHSLWMGVPVITMMGEHAVSRCAAPLLARAGLHEFITDNEEEYFQRAVQMAHDLPGLNQIRLSIREKMSAENCESQTITGHLEAAYQAVWQKWCAT